MSVRAMVKMPREHGAWVMLYVPMVVGVLVAWKFSYGVPLLALSATFLFIARESLLVWWRAYRRGGRHVESLLRLAIYLSLAGLAIAQLILVDRLYALVPLGLTAVFLLAVMLATTDQFSHLALVAFAPAITRASWSLMKTGGRLDLKRLGLLEILYSVVFLIFITLTFRNG